MVAGWEEGEVPGVSGSRRSRHYRGVMIRVKMARSYLGKKRGDDAQVRAGFPAEV